MSFAVLRNGISRFKRWLLTLEPCDPCQPSYATTNRRSDTDEESEGFESVESSEEKVDKADETVNVPEPTVNPDRSGLAYDYFYYNEISDNRDNQYHPDFDDYEFYYKNIYKYDLQAVP